MAFAVIFKVFLLAGFLNSATANNDDTLELLQVFIRHGNRTALQVFDQYKQWYIDTFRPFQYGQLTPQGRRQMLDVGAYFRERYGDFLPEEFAYTDVTVKCTESFRVQESEAVAMTAMFPPRDKQKWQNSGLGSEYVPIPCQYVPPEQDTLLEPDSTDCPRYQNLTNGWYYTPEYMEVYNELTNNETVNQYLQRSLNMSDPLRQQDLGIVWENLNGMESYGLTLPEWSKPVYPEPLTSIYALAYKMVYATPELIRFTIGELVKELLSFATILQEGQLPQSQKMMAYFGHDKTIYPLLVALGFETHPPMSSFGAALIMELHRNKTTSEIGYKFLFRNQTWSEPIQYTVPGCSEICPLSYVRQQLEPYIPTQSFYDYC